MRLAGPGAARVAALLLPAAFLVAGPVSAHAAPGSADGRSAEPATPAPESFTATPGETDDVDGGLESETEYEYEVAAVDGEGEEGAGALTVAETPPPGQGKGQGKGKGKGQDDDDDEDEDDEDEDEDDDEDRGDGGDDDEDDNGDDDDQDDGDDDEDEDPEEDTSPPSGPSGLSAEVDGHDEVELEWSRAEDPESGIDAYRVYRDGGHIATVDDTDYDDEGLSSSTKYVYEVSAVNGAGLEGPRSDAVTVTTEADRDDSPPGRPRNLSGEAVGPHTVDLGWSAAQDPESGVREYRVYRDGSRVATVDGTSYRDEGLDDDESYEYSVSAVNGADLEGERSDPVTVETPRAGDGSPPTEPEDLAAEARNADRVDLSWSAAEDPQTGVEEYRIYRDGDRIGSVTGTTFGDVGLDPDTEYTYRVSAVNGDGMEGPRSDPATARTQRAVDEVPPAAPTNLRVIS